MPKLPPFGHLVRHWRRSLGLSQEALAAHAGLSTRHLSLVETGRAQPSRETVELIATSLGVENRAAFLEAAGFIAPYPMLEEAACNEIASELDDLVARQPTPALAHDRLGTLIAFNPLFERLVGCFGDVSLSRNAFGSGRSLLQAMKPFMPSASWETLDQLYRARVFAELVRRHDEIEEEGLESLRRLWGPAPTPREGATPRSRVDLRLEGNGHRLALEAYTLTLGTPQDIPLRNYRVVLLFAADAPTSQLLVRLGRSP